MCSSKQILLPLHFQMSFRVWLFFSLLYFYLVRLLSFALCPWLTCLAYASDLSLSTTQGALILALMNITQVFGQVGIGYLSDHMSSYILLFGSTICSAVVVFLSWGFSNGFSQLLTFCLLYGLSAGGYSVLYCRFVTALTDEPAMGLFVYSIFEFERGLGNILAGPISSSLISKSIDGHAYGIAKYERLIIFVGVTFLVSSLGGLGYFFEHTCFQFPFICKKHTRPRSEDSQLVESLIQQS